MADRTNWQFDRRHTRLICADHVERLIDVDRPIRRIVAQPGIRSLRRIDVAAIFGPVFASEQIRQPVLRVLPHQQPLDPQPLRGGSLPLEFRMRTIQGLRSVHPTERRQWWSSATSDMSKLQITRSGDRPNSECLSKSSDSKGPYCGHPALMTSTSIGLDVARMLAQPGAKRLRRGRLRAPTSSRPPGTRRGTSDRLGDLDFGPAKSQAVGPPGDFGSPYRDRWR